MRKVKAVMMAGGFGTRIQPLTNSMPKPMLPITNIPMMEHILKKLKKSGIDEIIILLYYMPEVIKNYFEDGSKWGVKIEYVLPDADYGTAGAVGCGREFLDTTFIIVSGDLVTDFDFREIIDFHFNRKSNLTITLTSVDNPLEFGIVIIDENNKIEKFLEKPSWGEVFSDTINTGIYVIEPQILNFIPKNEPFDFSKDLFPLLMKKNIDLLGFTAKGYWRDVGNPDSYREVHQDIFNKKLKFEIDAKKIKYSNGELYLLGDSKIPKNLEIDGIVVIGNNVKIGDNVKLHNVSIGDNSQISSDTKIKNSVIWQNVKIGKKSILDSCVICDDTEIKSLLKAKAGAIIAQGVKIDKLVTIDKDITIWPDKIITPASIITGNVIFGTTYKNGIFNDGIIKGIANIEISCNMACKIAESFASQLPKRSKVIIAGDLESSSKMVKRAFIGGVLSTGIDVIDLGSISAPILRLNILEEKSILGGAYFRQSLYDPSKMEIILFNEEGLRLDREISKKIEKSFFKEDVRKVSYDEIGVVESDSKFYEKAISNYVEKIKSLIDGSLAKDENFKISIDLMWGITKDIYPEILKHIEFDNILLNSYYDSVKLSNIGHFEKESKQNLSMITKCLNMNMGVLIYPQGQRLAIASDDGVILDKIDTLNLVLFIYNKEAQKENKKLKVFLPAWAPDIFDEKFENLEIIRGKYADFKVSTFKKFDLIATIDGNFAFTEFAYHRDAVFASLKIMEMLVRYNLKISKINKNITPFYYKIDSISCSQSKKGKVMRNFIKYAKDKKHSTQDGIKIYENTNEWVLIIPDSYEEKINIYIQAENKKIGEKIYKKYFTLISDWIK